MSASDLKISELSQNVDELLVFLGGKAARRDVDRVETKIDGVISGDTPLSSVTSTGPISGSSADMTSVPIIGTGNTNRLSTITAYQPFQGDSYKKVIFYFNNSFSSSYEGDTNVYTFPTAFTNVPMVQTSNAITSQVASISDITATSATLFFPLNTTGYLSLEGF